MRSDNSRIDLRSLSQDIINEVSSNTISFRMDLHLSINWVKSSGQFQDYRFFEEMHHGIAAVKVFKVKAVKFVVEGVLFYYPLTRTK